MQRRLAAATALAALAMAVPAKGGEAGDILRNALYGGGYPAALEELATRSEQGDQEARFGVGFIRFVGAIEGFTQALHRHGLAAPDAGAMVPPLMLPVPANPDPEPLNYTGVRAILEQTVTSLDAAIADLQLAAASGDYVVAINPLMIRIDINGDGEAEETESLQRIFGQAFGSDDRPIVAPPEPEGRGSGPSERSRSVAPAEPEAATAPEATIGFDRADAFWLAGYSNVLAAQADFLLAHDFEDFVNASFHRLFPRAGFPMQDYATGGTLVLDPQTDTAIADAIGAIHSLDWEVIDSERLKRVRERFGSIIALSRSNWEAILAETDDNRELIPSPRQAALIPEGAVTEEVVSAWMETLDVAEQIVNGSLLVPHWRFSQGFDLSAYFETATRTDILMLLTGHDALPYLREGPIASADSFAAANRVFGDQFLGYVFWFN